MYPRLFTFSAVRFLQIFRLWVLHLQFEFQRRSFAASPSSSCSSYLQDCLVEFGTRITKRSFRLSLWNPKSWHFARLAALVDFVKDIASKWCEAHEESPNYGNFLDFETFNLYHATFWVIKPATLDHGREGCSYVELVAISMDDQRPKWFVSHAWLEPIVRFMRCLKQHALVRQLSPQCAYWVCASKKNQGWKGHKEKFWCVLVVYFCFFRFGKVLSVGALDQLVEHDWQVHPCVELNQFWQCQLHEILSKSDQRCICEQSARSQSGNPKKSTEDVFLSCHQDVRGCFANSG